ncbi:hypothetical protein J2P12_04515, partial [Candidatus Bathyarchaeota archaeon]|nr:hypothetical protein [Candidatus Bathyarchaeota archaeon]
MKTVRLLFFCAVVYSVLLVLVRGALPSESSPTLLLVGLPLVVIAVVIVRDLIKRSTIPTLPILRRPLPNPRDDPVKFLSGQIRVAAASSDSYFETAVRVRLRELLITKVSLETGLERDTTARVLSYPREGPRLLHSRQLHTILYG